MTSIGFEDKNAQAELTARPDRSTISLVCMSLKMAYSAISLPNNLARGENCGFDCETELVAANMRAHFLSFGDNFVGMSEKSLREIASALIS